MLLSSSRYSTESFLSRKRLFLDSQVIIQWANDPSLNALFDQVKAKYSLIICTVSLLEVGFGPVSQVAKGQVTRALEIYDHALNSPVKMYMSSENFNEKEFPNPAVYNPSAHEWLATRTHLLNLINETGRKVENARKIVNDALIYTCAWNARAAIISDNLSDFIMLNTIKKSLQSTRTEDGHLRHVPVFTIADLNGSIGKDVSYPENIPSHLKSGRDI